MPKGCYMFTLDNIDFDATVLAFSVELTELLQTSVG